MHLDDGVIQRLVHGELAAPADRSARAHAATCLACRERIASAQREEVEVDALLRQLDHARPPFAAATIAGIGRARRSARMRRAAGILLALGAAGGAWAAPGSPLPRWLELASSRAAGPQESAAPARPLTDTPDPTAGGIAVPPGESLLILIAATQAEGRARVSLTDEREVTVRVLSGAASFTSDVDNRIIIENRGSTGSFDIGIPRDAARVEIRVDGRRVFLKDGPRITTRSLADAEGAYPIPLAAS